MAASSKNALSLLSEYDSSDYSDDEVPGARVSTKRSAPKEWIHEELSQNTEKRKGKRLSLPSVLKVNSSKVQEVDDNADQHEGRIRSFPHERGNWATFVYVPYEVTPALKSFIDVVITCMKDVVDVRCVSDFHISVTRTVILRHHWINLFMESVQKNIQALSSFDIDFGSLKVYCNEEKTRTFVGLEILRGAEILQKCTEVLDKCLAEFKLPPYYKNPSFHMSLVWAVGDVTKQMSLFLPQLDIALQQFLHVSPLQWEYCVNQLLCKCGNKIFTFNFS